MSEPFTLKSKLIDDKAKRPRVLADCERLIDQEVADKGGLSGMGIKVAYKLVCAVKPGIIREVMDGLLDDFVSRVEPFWADHQKAGGDGKTFGASLEKRSGEVANALLGITDDRAKKTTHATLKSAYEKLRPEAVKHVTVAIPRVGRTLSPYL